MRILETLSDAFKTFFNSLNCISPQPRTLSLQRAVDAFSSNNAEVRLDPTLDRTDLSRLISYPREMPMAWYRGSASGQHNTQTMCMDDMTPRVVREMLVQLGIMLYHTSYKVCGLSALVSYGYTDRMPVYMTIACPDHSLQATLAWAATNGMPSHPEHPDSFGVQLVDGTTRKVKLEAMSDDAYRAMDSTMHGPSSVTVVTMAALVDAVAEIYVRETIDAPQRAALQNDIIWLLHRIIEDGSGVHLLRRETCPHVWQPRFWRRFNLERPDARVLFHRATYVPDDRVPVPPQLSPPDDLVPPPAQRSPCRVGRRRSVAPTVPAPTIVSDVDFMMLDDYSRAAYHSRTEGDMFFVPTDLAPEGPDFF